MLPSIDFSKITRRIPVVGLDPSMNNWGFARGTLGPEGLVLESIGVIQPVVSTNKQVRQNSKDVETAKQLADGLFHITGGAGIVFAEVPVGSQSARAMASYGVCVGILGAFRSQGKQFIAVTPTEVKMAATGKKDASKSQMIQWAINAHPEADWPMYKSSGKLVLSEAKAEHIADATAAIYAGLRSDPFQQLLPLFQQAA